MEDLWWLYALPYDQQYPVVCYDERPYFLIGEELDPLPMQNAQVRKEHYAYTKNGACALLAAIEPLTGKRLAQVHPRRTKKEYTLFCQALAAAYPKAKKIRLVQDNLNTHNASSFYENLSADQAFALAQRLAIIRERSDKQIKIHWQFSIEIARDKMNRHYERVFPYRSQLKKT
ncbi:MAG: transposase [Acidobacteria bacterium]|nr:transposase [Acidobacteriota bacterium]